MSVSHVMDEPGELDRQVADHHSVYAHVEGAAGLEEPSDAVDYAELLSLDDPRTLDVGAARRAAQHSARPVRLCYDEGRLRILYDE